MRTGDQVLTPWRRHRAAALLSLLAVVVGGLIGWSADFVGLDFFGGLALAVWCSGVMIVVLAHRSPSRPELPEMVAFGLAFALFTWPTLCWLVVGLARYAITGQSLGE